MFWQIYVRDRMVYIPTTQQIGNGPFFSGEPVEIVPVTDTAAVVMALRRAMDRGNPTIPALRREDDAKMLGMLKNTKWKSWSSFQKGASCWSIETNKGCYEIAPWTKQPHQGGFLPDESRRLRLPEGTEMADVAKRLAALVQPESR